MDKIYIIEDDQTIRNEIVQALKKWNFLGKTIGVIMAPPNP